MKRPVLQGLLALAYAENQRLSAVVQNLQADLDGLKERNHDLSECALRDSSLNDGLEALNAGLAAEVRSLHGTVESLNEELSGVRLECDNWKGQYHRLDRSYKDLYGEKQRHLLDLAQKEMHLQNLLTHLEALCWNFDEDEEGLASILETYKKHLEGGGDAFVVTIKPSIGEEGSQKPPADVRDQQITDDLLARVGGEQFTAVVESLAQIANTVDAGERSEVGYGRSGISVFLEGQEMRADHQATIREVNGESVGLDDSALLPTISDGAVSANAEGSDNSPTQAQIASAKKEVLLAVTPDGTIKPDWADMEMIPDPDWVTLAELLRSGQSLYAETDYGGAKKVVISGKRPDRFGGGYEA